LKAQVDEIKELRFYSNEVKHKVKFIEELSKGYNGDINPNDRYAFTRHLGVQEIVDGHKWKQVDEKDCYICRRDCYCVFFWSESLHRSEYLQEPNQQQELPPELNKILAKQPSDDVWISVQGDNNKFYRMLTL